MVAACALVAGSCADPPARATSVARGPSWVDAGTPASTMHLEREIRYYIDEQGMVWDDRGRKLERAP
jgi:hypothetical protein